MRVKKMLLLVILVLSLGLIINAADLSIVASTSWVGAIASAAGASEVTILAPIELRHPPEYDYRPGDVVKVLEADYIVWAGYEPFIKKMIEAAPEISERLIQVRTTNTPDYLVPETRKLAEIFGTQTSQSKWEEIYLTEMEDYKKRAQLNKVAEKKVVVSVHQNEFITWLGFQPIKVIGTTQLTPYDVVEILEKEPDLIIDNYNSVDGKLLVDNSAYVLLFNFPTKEYPELLDVLRENMRRLGL